MILNLRDELVGLSARRLFVRSHQELLNKQKIRKLVYRYYHFHISATRLLWGEERCCFDELREYGIFQIWTKEFIDAFVLYLKKTLSCPNALILDCGAGNGLLTFWLKKYGFNIVAVDSKSDEWEFTQNGKIPDWVLQMEVSEALEKFQPELVIASWMPPSWGYSLFDNYEWTDNFHSCPSVKEYILIGEESDEGNIPQCGSFYSWEGSPNWPRKDLPQLNALSLSYLDFLQKIERDRKSIICSFKKV
ncbi:MAG: hypothetical protein A3I89_03760 [Candidatus Harrisonbacteria bacterium RIFCSPLOWO2_02_FULL_41_11]|uniref:Methyltransferase domain-containing protein n=1 Tax=Candidatus Harrisonbacteria bacterium RIFCSPHIGHO2_02_FULL_42_16 TaxID=1798404 RepID=A0A1G1ZG62_9BACT|nr:MAG: hypothetical protein A3B92_01575 [Candidatus Harrisonbacteria bacterium RIFCSPHIGHO2_02_FULL_42_16]OGY66181.1 MAG: hypothetical protein A3I89_03760 [Candidatus Harrisonbacteria bacterium RIFCSPLOWO2_02_FULL_41_11]